MSKTSGPTIHRVFDVYDGVFSLLEMGIATLQKKRVQWKVDIRNALENAQQKARDYYSKTATPAGLLYGIGMCLNPYVKLSQIAEWDHDEHEGRVGYSPAADPDSYYSQYRRAFLQYFDEHYAPKQENAANSMNNPYTARPKGQTVTRNPFARRKPSRVPSRPAPTVRSEAEIFLDSEPLDEQDVNLDQQNREMFDISRKAGLHDGTSVTCQVASVSGTLDWWRKQSAAGNYPNLSRMARDVLAVQGHSVGAERAFSKARGQVTSSRNRLTAETIRTSMIVKHWSLKELQDQIIAEGELEETVTKRAIFDSIAVEQDVLESMGYDDNLLQNISDTDEGDRQDVGWNFIDTDGRRAFNRQPSTIVPGQGSMSSSAEQESAELSFTTGSNLYMVDNDLSDDDFDPNSVPDLDTLPEESDDWIAIRQRVDRRLGTSFEPDNDDFISDASSEWSSEDEVEIESLPGGNDRMETATPSFSMSETAMDVSGDTLAASQDSLYNGGRGNRKRLSGTNRNSPGKKQRDYDS